MALVPHKITALAESDAQGTNGSNIVAGAVVSLYDTNGTAVTLFDDAAGANGSTAKTTDATGQVVVYVTAGEYDEEVNGSIRRRVVVGAKEITTLQLIDRVRPAQDGDVITTTGFTSGGDGGGAQWKATATTVLTPSQSPADRGAAELVDGSGRLWVLVEEGAYNVKSFGATGSGLLDDLDSIQSAFNAVENNSGGSVFFPSGDYLVRESIKIPSNTMVYGYGESSKVFTKAAVFTGVNKPPYNSVNAEYTASIFRNKGFLSNVIQDENIVIRDLKIETDPAISIANQGRHGIKIRKARNVMVEGCTFGFTDSSVAFLACRYTLITKCSSAGFFNCAWDHWEGAEFATVTECFAETGESAQLVNFNAEATDAANHGNGLTASNFVMTSCQFKYTGDEGGVIQLEPINNSNTVKNVLVESCVFENVSIAARRGTQNVTISGCLFYNFTAGNIRSVITSQQESGGPIPKNISILGNRIIDAKTSEANIAAIRIWSDGYLIEGNTLTGDTANAALSVSDFIGKIGVNDFEEQATSLGVIGNGKLSQFEEPLSLDNLWQNTGDPYYNAAYFKDDFQTVYLRGNITGGTQNLRAFALPPKLRPKKTLILAATSNGAYCQIRVDSEAAGGGVVPITGNSNVSLDGISFKI